MTGGARPKHSSIVIGHSEEPNRTSTPTSGSFVFSDPSVAQSTSADAFENQAFHFTVGSSEKRPKSRGNKVKKKRDHSGGRSQSNK